MTNNTNPFITSGYRGPEYFCDRKEETSRLKQALQGGSNVTLISPRRIGKTGLIKHTFHEMEKEEPDALFFYIDIMATKSIAELAQLFAREIARKMESRTEKIKQWAQQFMLGFRPTLSFDSLTGDPEFSFNIQPSEARATLDSALDYIEQSGRRCYFAIDEFQQILNYKDQGTEALLRSKIQFMHSTNFIFSGSMMHLMSEMFLSPSHPFFHSTSILNIDIIVKETFRNFANGFFATQGRQISAADFAFLYDNVAGQTWYVQKILNLIYMSPADAINEETVKQAINAAIEEQETTYQYIVFNLTSNQKDLLKAIAKERYVKQPYAGEFIKTHNLNTASSVKRSLQSLEQQQLLYHDIQKGYTIYDRFFSLWLKRQV